MFAPLRSLWRNLTARARFEAELEDELGFHLEARADDLAAGGLSREEAARRARLELGSIQAHKEEVRRSRGLRFFDELRADVRFALRSWRRHLGLAIAVTATLTLGIGLSTAGFNLVGLTLGVGTTGSAPTRATRAAATRPAGSGYPCGGCFGLGLVTRVRHTLGRTGRRSGPGTALAVARRARNRRWRARVRRTRGLQTTWVRRWRMSSLHSGFDRL